MLLLRYLFLIHERNDLIDRHNDLLVFAAELVVAHYAVCLPAALAVGIIVSRLRRRKPLRLPSLRINYHVVLQLLLLLGPQTVQDVH